MAAIIRNLVRRFKYGEPIIVVSGLPRSGTSMTMKMLAVLQTICGMMEKQEAGLDEEVLLGGRAPDEVFPWEAVEVGPGRDTLLRSYDAALELIAARGRGDGRSASSPAFD